MLGLFSKEGLAATVKADGMVRSGGGPVLTLGFVVLGAIRFLSGEETIADELLTSVIYGFGITVLALGTVLNALQARFWSWSQEDALLFDRYRGLFTVNFYCTLITLSVFVISGSAAEMSWTKFGQGALVGCLLLYPIISWIRAIRSARTGKG
jgi:hypothetical protein